MSQLLTASLLATTSLSSAQGTVTGVNVASSANGVAIVVRGQKIAAPSISRINNGTVYVANFRGTLKASAGTSTVNRHGITTVQWSQFSKQPPVSRIVLKMRPSDQPTIAPIEGGYKITVGAPEADLLQEPVATPLTGPIGQPLSAQATPKNPILPLPKPTPSNVTTPKPLNPLIAQIVPANTAAPVAKQITLEFDDAKVSQILKALAIQAGVNIVTAPEVEEKKLTIKLEKVTTDHAMNVITAMSGLRYQQIGKTIVVAPPDRIDEIVRNIKDPNASVGSAPTITEHTETRIVPIYSRRRTQIETAVYRTVPKATNSGAYEIVWPPEADDYVMLIGHPSRLNDAEKTVKEIDDQISAAIGVDTSNRMNNGNATDEFVVYDVLFCEPRSLRDELVRHVPGLRASISPAAVGNPRLYDPKGTTAVYGGTASTPMAAQAGAKDEGDKKDATTGGTSGFNGGLQRPYQDVEPIAVPMRMILRGNSQQIAVARRVLSALDVAPRLVALEIRVMELSKEDALNIGLDWNIFTGGAVKFLNLSTAMDEPSGTAGVSLNNRNFTGDVVATLDKLANKNNLIARPNMLAPDGRESELFIGDVIRYVETITSSQNGPSVQIGTVRVGINLAVMPRISADGTMTLDLRPVVSFLTGFTRVSVQGFAAELPQTSERIAQQTIPMRSGETFAISGLIQSQDVEQLKGIPILMDLPIIGALFRRTTTQTIRKELVVFVTAKAINGPLSTANSGLPMESDKKEDKDAKAPKGK